MQDAEVELIMRTMADAVQTYDQVVEVRRAADCVPIDLVLDSTS